ncbi:signal peptidase I [Niallia taxi]|uniref:signal peptidase I n=1 Tax=Niallia taxi TaxID=2499688 RepID=UPI0015F38306|nr:signal peptidase I [Niallia taxi]
MVRGLRWIRDIALTVAIAMILTAIFHHYIIEVVRIPSGSMEPTIQIGERVMISKFVNVDNLAFGDIVVFYPPGEKERYIKRLIGLEGDQIEVKDGLLYRNGVKVQEEYLNEHMQYDFEELVVPEGKLFFLGDNRNHSFDSHMWETPFVEESQVVGKAVFKVYPFEEAEGL